MNKDAIKNLVLILLIGVAVFSMVRYVGELKARFRLQDNLTQTQGDVAALTQEKQNLLQELGKEKELNEHLAVKNVKLRAYVRASKVRMTRFFQQDYKLQKSLEDTQNKFSVLEAENRALLESSKQLASENEGFKMKLSSILELKMAIKELRHKKRKPPVVETEGNRGFLVKDGQLITQEKIKIEVVPAQTKE